MENEPVSLSVELMKAALMLGAIAALVFIFVLV